MLFSFFKHDYVARRLKEECVLRRLRRPPEDMRILW